jgi:uncharacterized protein (UPF0264 family)
MVYSTEMSKTAESIDTINLKIAADAAYTQVIRLATFMVASRMDFDISRIEDLRIAVDEACNYAILNSAAGNFLQVSIRARHEELEVLISFTRSAESEKEQSDLGVFSRMILESVLDGFEVFKEGELDRILLRKNRQ